MFRMLKLSNSSEFVLTSKFTLMLHLTCKPLFCFVLSKSITISLWVTMSSTQGNGKPPSSRKGMMQIFVMFVIWLQRSRAWFNENHCVYSICEAKFRYIKKNGRWGRPIWPVPSRVLNTGIALYCRLGPFISISNGLRISHTEAAFSKDSFAHNWWQERCRA